MSVMWTWVSTRTPSSLGYKSGVDGTVPDGAAARETAQIRNIWEGNPTFTLLVDTPFLFVACFGPDDYIFYIHNSLLES